MMNYALCLMIHLFGKNEILCKCPLNRKEAENDPVITSVQVMQVTNITQNGKANIAGDGTVQYRLSAEQVARLERLEVENKLLSEMVEILKNRDK